MKLIDKNKVIRMLKRQLLISNNDYEVGFNYGIDTAIQIILNMPTVNTEERLDMGWQIDD